MTRATRKLREERILGAMDRVPLEVYLVALALIAGVAVSGLVWLLC